MSEAAAVTQIEVQCIQTEKRERLAPEAIEKKYLDSINLLVDEARENESMTVLVDVLAWTLARIIMNCRTRWGVGDVIRRIGDHVCKLADQLSAQAEAEKARRDGLHPH